MCIHVYHKTLKHYTRHGKYKVLANALKKCKELNSYWQKNNVNWMACYVGEEKK